jgi:hypothetical protein
VPLPFPFRQTSKGQRAYRVAVVPCQRAGQRSRRAVYGGGRQDRHPNPSSLQNLVVDLVLAECRLVPFEAKAPRPTAEVHPNAVTLAGVMIVKAKQPVQADALGNAPFGSKSAKTRHRPVSFDHLVGGGEQHGGHGNA